jgi:hypothetical protein
LFLSVASIGGVSDGALGGWGVAVFWFCVKFATFLTLCCVRLFLVWVGFKFTRPFERCGIYVSVVERGLV